MSFYTSLSGLNNAQTNLNVTAQNIANSETMGFKSSRVAFSDIVASSASTDPRMIQGIGSSVAAITQNFSTGSIQQTGSALDLAVSGDGFFTTKSLDTGETLFTRNGAFEMDENGFIQDGSGNALQIFAPGADPASDPTIDAQIATVNAGGATFAGIVVDSDGSVTASYTDGSTETIGTVALASFVAPTGLKQVGSSNWEVTGISGAPTYGTAGTGNFGEIASGALEGSNVDIAEELVNLITAQRYFQANAKAIDTATQLSQTVINLRT